MRFMKLKNWNCKTYQVDSLCLTTWRFPGNNDKDVVIFCGCTSELWCFFFLGWPACVIIVHILLGGLEKNIVYILLLILVCFFLRYSYLYKLVAEALYGEEMAAHGDFGNLYRLDRICGKKIKIHNNVASLFIPSLDQDEYKDYILKISPRS